MIVKHEQVAHEMSRILTTIQPDDDLYRAYKVMCHADIRHLPVVDRQGTLCGILSDRDILRRGNLNLTADALGKIRVGEAMTAGVHLCRPGDRLGDIADTMLHHVIDALPVIDQEDNLIGIITSSDLLSYLRRTEGVIDEGAKPERHYIIG